MGDMILELIRKEGNGVVVDNGRYVLAPEQLRRMHAIIRSEVLEEAARIAQATVCDTHLPTGVRIYGTRAADAIRAAKEGS